MVVEAIFLLFYVGWLLYRAYDPSINTTEKPMDFAFFNASLQTQFAPPEDPWLRGSPISYYYFGYWMTASVAKLTAVPSNISYNIALAMIAAMSAVGIFGLVYNLVRSEANRWRAAVVAGVAGAGLLLLVGNMEGILELARVNGLGSPGFWKWVGIKGLDGPVTGNAWLPSDFWWWWRATRVIDTLGPAGASLDYTIQEFPFFSYLLGDLHPHTMSIPFLLLFMGLGLNMYLSPLRLGFSWLIRNLAFVVMLSLSLGALAFINAWDIVTFSALFVGLVFLKGYSRGEGSKLLLVFRTGLVSVPVIILAVVLYIPFYDTFNSQASAILPVDGPSTRHIHFLLIWALFLVAIAPFFVSMLRASINRPGWTKKLIVGVFFVFFPFLVWAFLHMEFGGGKPSNLAERFWNALPLMLLVVASIYVTLIQARLSRNVGRVYVLALMSLALLLMFGPELLFVADFFGNRMNTVFKFYYQAWVLFAVASAFGLYYWIGVIPRYRDWRGFLNSAWLTLLVILVAGSLYYPIASVVSKAGAFEREPTLDGLDYLAKSDVSEYEAILWLRDNVPYGSGILEAVGSTGDDRPGGDYDAVYGRISGSTGIPTVLGWFGHEHQWRGSTLPMEGRWEDVATIYRTKDTAEAKRLLKKYRIDYVYIGSRERREYGEEGLDKFAEFMQIVFPTEGEANRGESVIYKLP